MDTEINFLKPGTRYKDIITYDHGENTIYEFESVRYGNNNKESIVRKLKGTYLPIVPTPHHFHFLKEYVGSFLYYKEKKYCVKVFW
jgi:hypothetical protein